jgi:hypothetical protein
VGGVASEGVAERGLVEQVEEGHAVAGMTEGDVKAAGLGESGGHRAQAGGTAAPSTGDRRPAGVQHSVVGAGEHGIVEVPGRATELPAAGKRRWARVLASGALLAASLLLATAGAGALSLPHRDPCFQSM